MSYYYLGLQIPLKNNKQYKVDQEICRFRCPLKVKILQKEDPPILRQFSWQTKYLTTMKEINC